MYDLIDLLDELDPQERILVMDNAATHKTEEVQKAVTDRGYNVLYLSPWSPVLNPIEEF